MEFAGRIPWNCIQAEVRRLLGRDDVVPGMIAAIQTFGEILHWHPHLHLLVACGGFTSTGDFVDLKEFDLKRLEAAWQEAVFHLYLAENKIAPEVVENIRGWEHSGFSVDPSVLLAAGDQAGLERLVGYMTRCPFSLSRLVKVTKTGQVIYKTEKSSCRSFPEATGDGIQNGPKRNYEILTPLDYLAKFTQQRPSLRSGARPRGSHLVRYCGWYSNTSRGVRNKSAAESSEAADAERTAPGRSSATWAMLIKRVSSQHGQHAGGPPSS
jgi:hypothetical protein